MVEGLTDGVVKSVEQTEVCIKPLQHWEEWSLGGRTYQKHMVVAALSVTPERPLPYVPTIGY